MKVRYLFPILLIFLLCGCGSKAPVAEETEISSENTTTEESAEEETAEVSDVEEYYEENATVLDTIIVKDSPTVQTTAQAVEELTERGFDQNEVTYSYSYDGEYLMNGDEDENEKHPVYQTLYTSEAEELWSVFLINGQILANPVSYNMDSGLQTQVIFSESEMITGYDSETNTFYFTVPKEQALTVKVVEEINSNVLDGLTSEVIAGE
jgi:hypothetical protein